MTTKKKAVKKVRSSKEELVKFLQNARVQKYKDGDFEIEFSPLAFRPVTPVIEESIEEVDFDELAFRKAMGFKEGES
jgi:hypothetical protein